MTTTNPTTGILGVQNVKRSVAITFGVGLAAIALAAIVLLSRAPLTVAGTNSIAAKQYIEQRGGFNGCQPAGRIPAGTSAIRMSIEGIYFGPAVTVKVLSGSRVIREGRQIAGAGAIPTATVYVPRFSHPFDSARICTKVAPSYQEVRFYGVPPKGANRNAGGGGAWLRAEYLRPGPHSWWSLIPSIAYHMGLGHAPSGTWIVFLLLALMLAVVILAGRLTLRELR